MRSVQIVVDPPFLDDLTSMAIAGEEMLVQALVPQPPVEAFDKAVLHRLSRCDVVPLDVTILLPLQQRIGGEFGAVVADHQQGIATAFCDGIKLPGNTMTRDRVVDDGRQAFPAEVVNHAQDAEAASIDQSVGHEVEAPALIGILRDRHRCPCAQGPLAAATLANGEPFLAIEAVELLPVHLDALALQQDVQAAITEAPAL